MALQGDGNGIVTIPSAIATGVFSVIFSAVTLKNATSIIIGSATTNTDFLAVFSGPEILGRINGSSNTSPAYSGVTDETVKVEFSRDISNVASLIVDDVVISTNTKAGDFDLGTIFAYNNGSLNGSLLFSGVLDMTGFTGAGDRSYDFEGSGTTLVDTISGEDGTLSGFTTGGFTAPSSGISITSVVNDQFKKRDGSNQASFTISGLITGTATTVEYQLGAGAWATLDASPATTYSGVVIVTNEQDVTVRLSNDVGVTATVLRLKAAIVIAGCLGQSNEAGRGLNNQPLVVGGGNPTPAMYKSGVFSALSDPTGNDGSEAGSTWARIAQQYSDAGIPVGVANVGQGGSAISQWVNPGTYYNKIVNFAADVGGLTFTTGTIGETDQVNATATATLETQLNGIIDDLFAAYGSQHYITYYPSGNGLANDGATNVYDAFDNVILSNANALDGGDLRVIDIDTGVAAGNDGIHLKQDADLTQAADIRYTAFNSVAVSSTLNIIVTGIPDGSYMTVLDDEAGVRLTRQNETYTSGLISVTLTIAASTRVKGYVDDNLNPSVNGAYLEGVTV